MVCLMVSWIEETNLGAKDGSVPIILVGWTTTRIRAASKLQKGPGMVAHMAPRTSWETEAGGS